MKSLLIIASFPLLLNTISFQTPPDTLWTKVFGNGWEGGGCYGGDVGTSVLEKDGGGFIITGWVANENDANIWVLSTDEQGDTIWTKTFGGGDDDAGYCIQKDGNGYLIVGEGGSGPGKNYGKVLKINEYGNLMWERDYQFHPPKSWYTINLSCVRKLSNDDFIICGRHKSRPIIFRINSIGDTLWFKSIDIYLANDYSSIEQANNGDFIFSCNIQDGNGNRNVFLFRISEAGVILWEREYLEINGVSRSLQTLEDGGIVISGNNILSDTSNAVILKLNQDGDIIWQKTYTLLGNQTISCIRKLTDEGFILAGDTEIDGNQDALLLRTDQEGNLLWTKTLGGNYDDFAYAVEQTSDGGYIVTGGTCPDSNQVPDLWLIRLGTDPLSVYNEKNITTYYIHQNFPNPFNPTTTIKYQIPEISFVTLKVYDVLGNEITTLVSDEKSAGYYEVEFNASSLSSGIYFYRLQAGNYAETKKMILIK